MAIPRLPTVPPEAFPGFKAAAIAHFVQGSASGATCLHRSYGAFSRLRRRRGRANLPDARGRRDPANTADLTPTFLQTTQLPDLRNARVYYAPAFVRDTVPTGANEPTAAAPALEHDTVIRGSADQTDKTPRAF